jgi:hypothetical protein
MDADVQTQPRTLKEFFSSLEDTVSHGTAPDPATIIAEGRTYPTIRDFFLKRPELVAELMEASTNEGRLYVTEKFISYKQNVIESQVAELGQLGHENEIPAGPVVPILEKAIADAGKELQHNQKQKDVNAQTEYRRKVARKFVEQLREQRLYGTQEDIIKAVDRELNKPVYAGTENETKETIVENFSQAPEFSQDIHAAETIAKNVLSESKEFVAEKYRETIVDVAAAEKIIKDETLIDTKTFVETLTKNSVGNNQPIGEQVDYAVAAARASTVVNASRIETEGMRVGGILTMIPGVKEIAIREAFTNAWNKTVLAENFIETMSTRLGSEAVRSDVFQQMIKSGTDVAQQKHAAGAVVGSLGKIAGDLMVSVKGPPSEDMLHYVSALYEKQAQTKTTTTASPTQFIVTMLYTYSPSSFSVSSGGGGLSNWVLSWGARRAAAGAAKGIGKAAAEKVAVAGATKAVGAVAGGVVGGPVGSFVLGLVLDKVLSIGGKILGGITGGLGFLASGAWLQGKDVPFSSMLILGPFLLICAVAILPFVVIFSETTRKTALITSYNVGVGGYEEGPIVDCQTNRSDPLCKIESCVPQKAGDCTWPTAGYITQGPHAHCVNSGGRQTTHETMGAIDIGAPYNTPVIAVKGGEVVAWYSGCPDKPSGPSASFGCNGGWGNYIDISGGGYVLRYAHLALQSMSFTHLHMIVAQGQGIARVDNNGNSSGPHLHFGVINGPGGIFSVLPLSQTDANKVNMCIGAFAGNCPVICPNIYTSTK